MGRDSRTDSATGPATPGAAAAAPDGRAARRLLVCGALSSATYIAMDVITSVRYSGYRYRSQVVSELNATGAPTRRLFVRLSAVYNALLAAFALGVWASGAGRRRAGRIAAASLLASAVSGVATPLFFPMDRRGDAATRRGRMHPPMTALGSAFILLSMGSAASLRGAGFRRYTVATMAVLVAAGAATGLYVPRIDANRPTPGVGIVERVNIYAYLLWVAVLGASLRRATPGD
jgi:hypothetical membrane protein